MVDFIYSETFKRIIRFLIQKDGILYLNAQDVFGDDTKSYSEFTSKSKRYIKVQENNEHIFMFSVTDFVDYENKIYGVDKLVIEIGENTNHNYQISMTKESDIPLKKNIEKKASKIQYIRDVLTGANSYLLATIVIVIAVLPFTISSLYHYIDFKNNGGFLYQIPIFLMCVVLAIALDFSILIFTINGKERLATFMSLFQVVFISSHFNLLNSIFSESTQSMIVKITIVIFVVLLINRLSKLSTP